MLVEYAVDGDELHAVVFADGRATLRSLGPAASVAADVRSLSLLLDRLARGLGGAERQRRHPRAVPRARGGGGRAGAGAARVARRRPAARAGAGRDRAPGAVVRPAVGVGPARDGRALGHGLVRGGGRPRPGRWRRRARGRTRPAARRRRGQGGAEHYPDSTTLVGDAATVAATLEAFDGAALAHVAAHGSFRADNPLFSSLRLADGPLTVYDLEGIGHAPRTVVLAACDTAKHTARPGDDLLGLAAAFLSLGTRTLVAPLVSLPDDESAALMVELHARLRAGQSPAAALAEHPGAPRCGAASRRRSRPRPVSCVSVPDEPATGAPDAALFTCVSYRPGPEPTSGDRQWETRRASKLSDGPRGVQASGARGVRGRHRTAAGRRRAGGRGTGRPPGRRRMPSRATPPADGAPRAGRSARIQICPEWRSFWRDPEAP